MTTGTPLSVPALLENYVKNTTSTRLDVQLNGIRRALSDIVLKRANLQLNVSTRALSAANDQPGIEPSAAGDQSITLSIDKSRWLRVAPLIPGSLLCNELTVHGDFSPSVTLAHQNVNSGKLLPVSSELFHTRFSPLPDGLHSALGHNGIRVLVFLPECEHASPSDDDANAIVQLLSALPISPSQLSVVVIGAQAALTEAVLGVVADIRCRIPGLACLTHTRVSADNIAQRLQLMGHASLALVGSKATATDSLLAGLPVAIWNPTLSPTVQTINSLMFDTLDWHTTNNKRAVADDQMQFWWQHDQQAAQAIRLDNQTSSLSGHINHWLDKHCTASSQSGDQIALTLHDLRRKAYADSVDTLTNSADRQMVMAMITPAANDRVHQFKSAFDHTRRKLLKFRQSPSRFIQDSQHRWLKSLTRRKP